MRRAILLATTLLATGGAPGAATANNVVKLRVAFEPNRAGARTTIEFGFHIRGPKGAPPSPVTSLSLRLPARMGIATTTLGQRNCYPANLIDAGLQGCSANARIGFGDAIAIVPLGTGSMHEKVSLNALMGPPVEDHLEVLFYLEGIFPLFAQFILPGIVLEDTNPFGERINTSIPLVQAWPDGPDVALESFRSTIGPLHLTYHRQVSGRTISYQPTGITVPRHCPRGGYPFAALLTFLDGTHTDAEYRVPCPER